MNAIDPQIAAELDRLEAALNGAPDADPALVALVEDVRATTAPMPLALHTRLEDGIAAGFPRERRRLTLPHVRPLPALGAVASVLIATVVGVSALQSGDPSQTGVSDHAKQLSAPLTTVAPSAPSGSAGGGAAGTVESDAVAGGSAKSATPGVAAPALVAPAAPTPSSDNARGFARKVERAVDLTLRVGGRELQDTADGVVRTTQALGGYVATSNVSATGRGGHAEFTLRVPTAQLDVAIARLSKLGHVARLEQSSQDITGSFVSVASRLKDARAERRALLRALAKATTANQIAALRARIRMNRSEIARYNGQLDALRRRADLATVQLSIIASGKATVTPAKHHRWTPADAARDAVHVLEAVLGALLVALAVLLPAGVLAGLAWAAARTTRRRRREHALDTH